MDSPTTVPTQTAAAVQSYDPEFEWPEEGQYHEQPSHETSYHTDLQRSSSGLRPGQPIFRLLALRSSILPKAQRIAVLDAYTEVQIGRDVQTEGSTTPRIRLKEMEVSKFHATVYWDGARKEWNLVDMGSMHGTYVRSGPVHPDSEEPSTRLSQARAASMPRRLRHSDHLKIGGTVFEVHIHDNQRPCPNCTTSGQQEIALFPSSKKSGVKRTRDVAGIDPGPSSIPPPFDVDRNPKKALNSLKRSLLTRHDVPKLPSPSVSADKQPEYVDRAARRRLLHPASRPDTPGLPTTTPVAFVTPSTASDVESLPQNPAISLPNVPLPSTNIGHRLLMQQGWSPGNALGQLDPSGDRAGLIDPLEVKHSKNRAGLGMKTQPQFADTAGSTKGLSWKDREKFKRFQDEGLC